MLRHSATFFSWVFQPLLMPIYGALLFFESSLLRIYIITRFGQMVCIGVQSTVHFSDAGCVDFAFVPVRNDYITHPGKTGRA